MHFKKIKGSKTGTIVFIHGNSSSSSAFKHILKSSSEYTMIAIDLPGHGESQNNYKAIEDFSLENLQSVCTEFINSIDDDILLFGNSFGGNIAIEIANSLNRLRGLVIFGTPPVKKPINFEDAYLPLPEVQVFFTENPSQIEIKSMAEVAVFDTVHTSQIISDFKKTNPIVRKAIGIDIAEGNYGNEYEIFVGLNIPKFIIAGKQDSAVNLDYLKNICDVCNNCQIFVFEECGHYPSLEQPNKFSEFVNNIANQVFK